MEIIINVSDDYHVDPQLYEKLRNMIKKKFNKPNIYKCKMDIYYKEEKYNKVRKFNIKIFEKSKTGKNHLIKEYNEHFQLLSKKFYSKNKNNSIFFDYFYEKIKYKTFYINGEKTRHICYYDDGFVENIKHSTKKRKDDIRLDRGKVFLNTCNGIQYYLLTPNNYHRDEGMIQIIKDKKQIDLIGIRFDMGITRGVCLNSLKAGKFTMLDTMNNYILNFEDATYKSVDQIEFEERMAKYRKEYEEDKKRREKYEEYKREYEKGYHTKFLDINFESDTKKQFVNEYMVKAIYDHEFKIFIDSDDKYRTSTGKLISHINEYVEKCEATKKGEVYKKKTQNYNNYNESNYSTDDYIYEAFDGNEDEWEDYCEDLAERYG